MTIPITFFATYKVTYITVVFFWHFCVRIFRHFLRILYEEKNA